MRFTSSESELIAHDITRIADAFESIAKSMRRQASLACVQWEHAQGLSPAVRDAIADNVIKSTEAADDIIS